MSFTLKIHWLRFDEVGIQADETTLFIPADEVRVHGPLISIDGEHDPMQQWDPGDFFEYRNIHDRSAVEVQVTSSVSVDVLTRLPFIREDGRLILVRRNGVETWYTASRAWILGPTGSTIERVAP